MKFKYMAIFAVILVALLLVGCSGSKDTVKSTPTKDTTTTPVKTTETVKETPKVMETVKETTEVESKIVDVGADVTKVATAKKEETGLAVDTTPKSTIFPEASCSEVEVKGKKMNVISAKVMNTGTTVWKIYSKTEPKGKVRLSNRGVTDITPGCDKYTLNAGESVVCKTIDVGVVSGENRVGANTPDGQQVRIVKCP